MFAVRRRALAYSSRTLLARRTNTSLSDSKNGEAPHPNTQDTHTTVPPIPSEEGFGKGFYISIATVVGCIALYNVEQSISGAGESSLTRAINYYSDLTQQWEDRNNRHTAMVERAAADRSLFEDSKPSGTINLKFPESFNASSPYNNEVGWTGNYLAALQAHYEAGRKVRK